MAQQLSTQRRSGHVLSATAWLLMLLALPTIAGAQSAATKYQRVVAREKAARASTASVTTLRAIAKSYEAVTRAHPTSGYADNALWQAAGILSLAYERSGQRGDLDRATSLLSWLKKEYPGGSLAKQVDAKLVVLNATKRAPVAPRAVAASAPRAGAADTAAPPPMAPVMDVKTPAPGGPSVPVTSAPTKITGTTTPRTPSNARPAATTAPAPNPAPAITSMPLPPSAPATSVRGITHSKLPRGDRLTIELTSEGAYSTTRAANPDRVILEVANATAGSGITERASGIAGNLVKSVTVTRGNDEATRFVMEVTGNPRFSTFPLYSPNRLILDIETEAPAQPVSMQPVSTSASGIAAKTTTTPLAVTSTPAPSTPASTSRGEYPLARQLGLGVSRIVVDPGHGGHDPGAQANGVTEAELVLDIATRVAAILGNQAGVDVVLTRKTDEFIPLEERTAIANREKADMFISIHANASLQSATRGIETYFLDFATTEEAKALAARENASSTQSMRLLPDLVRTIALTNKADESRELARSVQTSLVRRLAPDAKGLRDLGVKRAPFVVLIGAQMPSVLAEVSFLTNRADASLLKQPNYRQRIAQALADAILKYRSSLKKVAPTPGTRSD